MFQPREQIVIQFTMIKHLFITVVSQQARNRSSSIFDVTFLIQNIHHKRRFEVEKHWCNEISRSVEVVGEGCCLENN